MLRNADEMIRRLLLATTLVLTLSVASYGQEREIIQLQADIIRLTQQVAEIQNSLDDRNATLQGLVEQLADRVIPLADAVERISGALDDVRSSTDRLSGEMRVLVSNLGDDVEIMNRNLSDLRTEMNSVSQQLTTLNTTTTQLESPEGSMRLAFGDMLAGNYDLAIEGFRAYIDDFPASPRASEAQLYIGDSYFNQDAYEQAIIEYDFLLQKYPESDKTVIALFKKGLALAAMDQTQDALTFLRQVVSDYPDSTEAVSAQSRIEALGGQ